MDKETIVVLSGAGTSAESGLGTFRDRGGLWDQYPIEEVATPEAWEKDPAKVTAFYNLRRKQCYEAEPNAGHKAIADLEEKYNVIVVTQNIDNLHERAGSTQVIHLHGEITKVKSSGPSQEKRYYEHKHWEVKMGDVCPEGFQLRPHVVWFGEAVPMLEKGAEAVKKAAIFIIVGTSLNVYPAASLIHYVQPGVKRILIDPSDVSVSAEYETYKMKATEGLVKLRDRLLK
jgi:NAD-dependent deacetylase